MLNQFITKYQDKPNFTSNLHSFFFPAKDCLPNYTCRTLHIGYTEGNAEIHRYYTTKHFEGEEEKIDEGYDICTYMFYNSENGEVIAQFYNETGSTEFMDLFLKLKANRVKFKIYSPKWDKMFNSIQRGKYKLQANGFWRKCRR